MSRSEPLWTPSADRIAAANLTRFARGASYPELYEWSVTKPDEFWGNSRFLILLKL